MPKNVSSVVFYLHMLIELSVVASKNEIKL